ncbi:MAG TPA: response regulator transcription factor [Saprospiraceae bacterium]|nr:response regulator transcription factor [Saprospiraceae bacterium]MCB9268226.1 response regulator transcription factor [Lewinellaceae bacterium]HPG06338.1 response regulator transcription factor [Saprospiraceae bacterium]HPR02249.1 response regulator transcription factor [Saprospiraceae bacterium]HRV86374.1 response regulator transcription factor [Saprospiraceae bacterium]
MKILVVEDELKLRESICEYLHQEQYVCEVAGTMQEADLKLDLYEYDLVILDLMLPDGLGFDLLKQIKSMAKPMAVLILSARQAVDDKVNGLNSGADDYLTKPFHFSELNARIKALLRRRVYPSTTIEIHGDLEIDTSARQIRIGANPVEVTRKEYDLLMYLVLNKNRVVTKSAIAEHLWGDYMDLADNFDLVYSHIKNLRKKIMDQGGQDPIQTIYGLGYQWKPE